MKKKAHKKVAAVTLQNIPDITIQAPLSLHEAQDHFHFLTLHKIAINSHFAQ